MRIPRGLQSGRMTSRTAVVTGASRGIGLAIAARLVERGDRVVITARKADELSAAVETLGGSDVALAVPGNAGDPEHRAAAVRSAIDSFGSCDYVVSNVGINPIFGRVIDTDLEAARKIFDVNYIGALGFVQEGYHQWMGRNGGAALFVASVAGMRSAGGIGVYGSSKAALFHLTSHLGVELGPEVRVNAIAPAVVKTKFATTLFEGREEEVVARYPAGRLGVPEDIASAAAFLLSDDASWITGQTLVIDGGLTSVGDL